MQNFLIQLTTGNWSTGMYEIKTGYRIRGRFQLSVVKRKSQPITTDKNNTTNQSELEAKQIYVSMPTPNAGRRARPITNGARVFRTNQSARSKRMFTFYTQLKTALSHSVFLFSKYLIFKATYIKISLYIKNIRHVRSIKQERIRSSQLYINLSS